MVYMKTYTFDHTQHLVLLTMAPRNSATTITEDKTLFVCVPGVLFFVCMHLDTCIPGTRWCAAQKEWYITGRKLVLPCVPALRYTRNFLPAYTFFLNMGTQFSLFCGHGL